MSSAGAELPPPSSRPPASARELIESPAFRALVRRRWTVSFGLLLALFVAYYGYILVIANARAWVSQPVSDAPGAVTTIAIPLGLGAIVVAWVLTAVYVLWANGAYDPEVQRLKDRLKR
jgi:uncharacterized membrane protein (DUF485 family)